jgi:hypothetical protein
MPNLTYPSKYSYIKRFVNVPSAVSGGTNGVTSLDDPTYLGFSLLFVSNSPLFNGCEGGATEAPTLSDNNSPEDNIQSAQSSPSTKSGESAVGYLEQIGENKRAQYLRAFVQGIQEINRTRPYYFQGISGLTEAWSKSTDLSSDPYIGTTADEGITIGCLEAIDLKLSALFSLYKLAVFDTKYRRYVLPKNLCYFDVIVYVHEIRKFKTARDIESNNNELTTLDFVNQNTSQIAFKFGNCMWDAKVCGKVFDTVSNSATTIASTDIKFSYSTLWFDSQFSGYNSSLNEGKDQMINSQLSAGIDPKIPVADGDDLTQNSNLGQRIRDLGKAQGEGLRNVATQRVNAIRGSLELGNVFGLRNQALGVINNPQGLANALNGAALNIIQNINAPDIPQKVGDKILPPGRLPTNNDGTPVQSINSQRLFSPIPPGPPLRSTNIFE